MANPVFRKYFFAMARLYQEIEARIFSAAARGFSAA
ncbi:MAG: hypothetical protein JWQ71_58 [Pedosphaera sp.]|nr:hypothetical protein [Pedosphaera sp.]